MSPNPAANTAFVRAGDWKGLSDSDAVVVIPYEPTYKIFEAIEQKIGELPDKLRQTLGCDRSQIEGHRAL